MNLSKWSLKEDLKELAIKCTSLKESTAKKYAGELYTKFSEDTGCITNYSNVRFDEQQVQIRALHKSLNVLKNGIIQSEDFVLKLEDVSSASFEKEVIIVETKNGKIIKLGKGYEYLKYVFKYIAFY